jgi:hypothetical protein
MKMNKIQAMEHMATGGWVYRDVPQYGDRFFYKIEDGKLLCRDNDTGGWNPAFGGQLRDYDVLYVAEVKEF